MLRLAVQNAGVSQSELSRRSGISPSVLSRFVGGIGGLSMNSLDRLTDALGVVLMPHEEWQQRENIWRAYRTGRLRQVQAAPAVGG